MLNKKIWDCVQEKEIRWGPGKDQMGIDGNKEDNYQVEEQV